MLIEDLLTEKSRQLFTIEQKKTVEESCLNVISLEHSTKLTINGVS